MPQLTIASAQTSYALNLKRLLTFRAVAIAGELVVLGIVVGGGFSPLPWQPILSVIGVFFLVTLFTWYRFRVTTEITAKEFFIHLLIDVAALSAIVYFANGSSNPFASLFLLPLTMAAAALPARYTWAMAVITATCYSLLMQFHVPIEHHHETDMELHVIGMWLNFIISATLIAFFVVRMGNTVRERDLALASAREKQLQDERLVAIGTLAASAAHEMGTPLATMAVLAKELEKDCAGNPDIEKTAKLLHQQVKRCKNVLSSMADAAGQSRADAGRGQPIDQYLNDLFSQWRTSKPGLTANINQSGTQPVPHIVVDQTLSHAILNILNNAADASPKAVDVNVKWDDSRLELEINDYGPGLTAEAQTHAGDYLFTSKGEGLGLGLFLANASISRLGGNVSLNNRNQGGACARITLPIEPLKVNK